MGNKAPKEGQKVKENKDRGKGKGEDEVASEDVKPNIVDIASSTSSDDPGAAPAPAAPPPPSIKYHVAPAPKPAQLLFSRLDLPFQNVDKIKSKPIRIVCVSDTHNYAHKIAIPDADIFLHAGDFTVKGKEIEVIEFNKWLGTLPHKHKIVIAGNHEKSPDILRRLLTNCTLLEDESITVEGIKIYGTRWRSEYKIPTGLDVLMTHCPPSCNNKYVKRTMRLMLSLAGQGDIIYSGESVGSSRLAKIVTEKKPVVHLFGHNHGYGATQAGETIYLNAATCLGGPRAVNRRQAICFVYYRGASMDWSRSFGWTRRAASMEPEVTKSKSKSKSESSDDEEEEEEDGDGEMKVENREKGEYKDEEGEDDEEGEE